MPYKPRSMNDIRLFTYYLTLLPNGYWWFLQYNIYMSPLHIDSITTLQLDIDLLKTYLNQYWTKYNFFRIFSLESHSVQILVTPNLTEVYDFPYRKPWYIAKVAILGCYFNQIEWRHTFCTLLKLGSVNRFVFTRAFSSVFVMCLL